MRLLPFAVAALLLLLSSPAIACEPTIAYDWAVPAESGCVTLVGPPRLPDSPELEVTNGCNTTVTLLPVDCPECDVELVLTPLQTGNFKVHHSLGEDETAEFGLMWSDEEGSSGSASGAVSVLEGAGNGCDDDSGGLCAVAGGDAGTGSSLLLLVGLLLAVRRRV